MLSPIFPLQRIEPKIWSRYSTVESSTAHTWYLQQDFHPQSSQSLPKMADFALLVRGTKERSPS